MMILHLILDGVLVVEFLILMTESGKEEIQKVLQIAVLTTTQRMMSITIVLKMHMLQVLKLELKLVVEMLMILIQF